MTKKQRLDNDANKHKPKQQIKSLISIKNLHYLYKLYTTNYDNYNFVTVDRHHLGKKSGMQFGGHLLFKFTKIKPISLYNWLDIKVGDY